MKYPNLIFMFRQIKIINGQFPVISRKSSHSLTCISVYCHHIRICYHICCIKRCYKKPQKMTKRGIHISWGMKQGIKLQGGSNNPLIFIMGYLTSRSWKYLISTKGGTLYSLPSRLWQKQEGQDWRICYVGSGTGGCPGSGMKGYILISILLLLRKWLITWNSNKILSTERTP